MFSNTQYSCHPWSRKPEWAKKAHRLKNIERQQTAQHRQNLSENTLNNRSDSSQNSIGIAESQGISKADSNTEISPTADGASLADKTTH